MDEAQGTDYPNLLFVCGQVPAEAPERKFESDSAEGPEIEDDLLDDYDESYNWN